MIIDLSEYTEFHLQVGGHTTSKSRLKAYSGSLIKPFQDKDRGLREKAFYDLVFDQNLSKRGAVVVLNEIDTALVRLRPFLPRYYGCLYIASPPPFLPEDGEEMNNVSESECQPPSTNEGESAVDDGEETKNAESECKPPAIDEGEPPGGYLVLEDVTWKFHKPCVMDVKLGTRSYEATASPEKVAYEKSKFPLQEEMGIRIQGIKVYDPSTDKHIEYDKHFGRLPTSIEDVSRTFAHFFQFLQRPRRQHYLKKYIERLEELKSWFKSQDQVQFIASSLLFVHDQDKYTTENTSYDLRMIDFAHFRILDKDSKVRDAGEVRGIDTIIECLTILLHSEEKFDALWNTAV
uniref:Kinase n=1 Tax=Albugo laibachii Nc14 TaxID=890382 RepID=F0W0L8_9STRA|nr:inositol polyphosphate multikinase putative [Albugo laibachii Nc14]|eukprot:CCA14590.1 inositol polyphosphate multikinase putative [Albugo laibachii Nc14]